MRRIFEEFPEVRRTLKDGYRARIFHDILTDMMGEAIVRSQPTIEQQLANLMAAGYHVSTKPQVVVPMRKPGMDLTPPADEVLGSVTPDSQRGRLLLAYAKAGDLGLTDEDAARESGVPMRSCWWKRCGELRKAGLIEVMLAGDDDIPVQREGSAGTLRTVCTITSEGYAAIARFE